jgi:NAD(P)-dependent dehydrogenase (short-subunit alcohol dehydrogenase family)
MNIANAVALVTGANRGLGLEFAKALLARGARKVYAAAREPAAVTLPGVQAVRLDVTRPEQIEAAARELPDVQLVINNAGISRRDSFLSATGVDAVRAELETNFFGPLLVSRAFAPALARNGGGAIVNVLSVLSWISFARSSTYSASKAAAWSLTNGLRVELRPQQTQVLAVHVGFVDTDMTREVDAPKSRADEVVGRVLDALEAGAAEVLADETARQVKAGLSAERAVYLGPPAR